MRDDTKKPCVLSDMFLFKKLKIKQRGRKIKNQNSKLKSKGLLWGKTQIKTEEGEGPFGDLSIWSNFRPPFFFKKPSLLSIKKHALIKEVIKAGLGKEIEGIKRKSLLRMTSTKRR